MGARISGAGGGEGGGVGERWRMFVELIGRINSNTFTSFTGKTTCVNDEQTNCIELRPERHSIALVQYCGEEARGNGRGRERRSSRRITFGRINFRLSNN